MALGECRECGKQVSDEAKNCPHCGVGKPVKSGVGPIKMIAILGIGALIFAKMMSSGSNTVSYTASPAPAKQEKTPSQIALEQKKELAFQKTVLAAATLKKSLREPESLVWESILANDDASVICLEYRSRNGFGGMGREIVVMANGKATQKVAEWNRHCTGPLMNDMKNVKYALK